MLEVLPRGIHVVGLEGAAGAALLPAWAEHEVLHEELAAPGEEIAQRNRPLGPFEDVVLLDLHPGQRTALLQQLVALARERLLGLQVRPARRQPDLAGYDLVLHGPCSSFGGKRGSLCTPRSPRLTQRRQQFRS